MKISTTAKAGALESNDVLVTVMPNDQGGVQIQLETKRVILKQFGKQIEEVVRDKVAEMGVDNVIVKVQDKGALDYTIRARVQTALERALASEMR
ncbi:citrate lyase subunit gamma (acyl carrier protein) [Desulfitobacterium sp. LBE]|uniref:Citrate lyase ACP n=2 Tax=root TaxID=1 RepID=A0A0W1JKR3_DESHA|nr:MULTISPECIES: citrate lyase acyl carrier protein [Desulfitobacterium]KTE92037.1 citrate lyase ACP [Desulfitobacterium hafniense]MEA5021327.1 citrate lyase acyl carrier protein [Desulfitobacterium hafniense]TWH60014.1 citrate lyase subunit gamma (acyl carrier protein) [Desulfitobacterium sp. LBE]